MYKVITAPTPEPVTLAEARLQIKADSDTTEDTLITGWIKSARKIAEQYTGRALAPQTLEMALDCFPGGDDDYIDLPTAEEIEHAYDHTRHPNQLVEASGS